MPTLPRRLVTAIATGALLAFAGLSHAAGIPPAYSPMVIEPALVAGHSEFDLGAAIARAKRENKRLYVYLGASDCPYCRRYENFLGKNADELLPHFKPWIVVDLRSTLSTTRCCVAGRYASLPFTFDSRPQDSLYATHENTAGWL